ncbi:MAG: Clp protease ClpP, partial [Dialister sp.]|nr:Clp protease ClpP [Dialister sp.]
MSKFWKIKNEAGSANVELYLYGQIAEGSWNENDKGAKEFADDLLTCEGKDITLRINSPGGNIFSAQAIYNVLKAYPGKVTAHIDGICASAATVVACGAGKVVMPKNALYMIHNPMACVFDMLDAEALRKMADTLAKVKETVVNVYKDRAGDKMSADEIIRFMDEETWMNAEEALEKGLIDEIDDYAINAQMKNGLVVVNSISMPVKDRDAEKIRRVMKTEERKKTTEMNDSDLISKIKALLGDKPKAPKEEPKEDIEAAERQRITALEALAGEEANPYVDAVIASCKGIPGMTAETAKPIVDALKAVHVEPKEDTKLAAIRDLIEDNMQSGASSVKAVPQMSAADTEKAKNQAAVADIVARMN